MISRFVHIQVCVFLALACGYSAATLAEESANKETKPIKIDKEERALVLDYLSVFDNYLPFDEVPEIGWKEANDNVGRIGGWRAYLKMVQEEANRETELEEAEKTIEPENANPEPEQDESKLNESGNKAVPDEADDVVVQEEQHDAMEGSVDKARQIGGQKL